MKAHSRLPTRTWMLVVGLIAGLVILYYLLSSTALVSAAVSGLIVLMVIAHLGLLAALLGPLYARFRRRSRH